MFGEALAPPLEGSAKNFNVPGKFFHLAYVTQLFTVPHALFTEAPANRISFFVVLWSQASHFMIP